MSKTKKIKATLQKTLVPREVAVRVSRPFYLAIAFILAFGASTMAKAAERVKRLAKGTRDTLKSSLTAYLTARAWGYFHPVWDETTAADGDTFSQKESILSDPEHRIEKVFQVPKSLRGRVGFWVDVYSRFSSEYKIVHDRDNPELVYGYIDMRPLYRAFSPALAKSKGYEMEKRILKELKGRIAEAMTAETKDTPDENSGEKIAIRALLAKYKISDPDQIQTLFRHMRTQTGQRDFFLQALQRAEKFLPEIEPIFREYGLPVGLARLPFVESSFNPKARSKDGAMGMWQIMPETSKLFDRKGTRREWAEPIRQSKSAGKLLRLLGEKLPDWGIAITAYNSGAARLARIVKKNRIHDVEDLIELPASKDALGFAGRNFYCELLAANFVEGYREKLFPASAVGASRLMVSRKVQSLVEGLFAGREMKTQSVPTPVKKAQKRDRRAGKRKTRISPTPFSGPSLYAKGKETGRDRNPASRGKVVASAKSRSGRPRAGTRG